MSGFRRAFQITAIAFIVLLMLDRNARMMAASIIQNGYAFMARAQEPPIPLARPPLLGLADLDDCLRGTARIDGDNAYAAFCADLAGLSGETGGETNEARMAVATLPAAPPGEKHAPDRKECIVDALGVPARKIDDIWVKADRGQNLTEGESNRLIAVPASCPVQSPAEGNVLYAGFFKGYSGVVILETAKKKRITVAGLGRVAIQRGEKVALGGEIGTTPESPAPALAEALNGRGEAVLLYVADGRSPGPAS